MYSSSSSASGASRFVPSATGSHNFPSARDHGSDGEEDEFGETSLVLDFDQNNHPIQPYAAKAFSGSQPTPGTPSDGKTGKSDKSPKTPKSVRRLKKDKSNIRMAPLSPYMLWSRDNRQRVTTQWPGLDFSQTSKKLGELWKSLPNKDKMMWKKKAKDMTKARLEGRANMLSPGRLVPGSGKVVSTLEAMSAGTYVMDDSPEPETKSSSSGRTASVTTSARSGSGSNTSRTPARISKKQQLQHLVNPFAVPETYAKHEYVPTSAALIGTRVQDAAAYLKLLGDSLTSIGNRLAEHRPGTIPDLMGQSESRLLDALMCSITPLMCLTQVVPELRDPQAQETLTRAMENLAFIMPGQL